MGTHSIFESDFDCLTENMSDKAAALKEKLANLKRKRQEAKTANHRDVVEEDRVAKLPENFEARKSNKDPGFTSWADNTARQYNKLTKGVAPDWERYEREKAEMGDDFYANSGTAAILPGRLKDSELAKSRLTADINKQIERRQKFHRRRCHDEDKDITYINERNRKFNEKIDRSYSKYTTEIKQNLERGTAI